MALSIVLGIQAAYLLPSHSKSGKDCNFDNRMMASSHSCSPFLKRVTLTSSTELDSGRHSNAHSPSMEFWWGTRFGGQGFLTAAFPEASPCAQNNTSSSLFTDRLRITTVELPHPHRAQSVNSRARLGPEDGRQDLTPMATLGRAKQPRWWEDQWRKTHLPFEPFVLYPSHESCDTGIVDGRTFPSTNQSDCCPGALTSTLFCASAPSRTFTSCWRDALGFACDSASVDPRLRLRPPTVVNLKLGPLLPSVARGPPGEERPRTEDLDVSVGVDQAYIRPTTKQTLTAAESEEDEGKGNTPLPIVFGVACPLNVTLLTEIKWSTSSILSGLRSACRRPKPASGDDSEGGALTRLHRLGTVGQDSSAKLRRSDEEGPSRRGRKEEGERDRGAGCHAFLLWAELKHGSRPSAAVCVFQPFADILLHRPGCFFILAYLSTFRWFSTPVSSSASTTMSRDPHTQSVPGDNAKVFSEGTSDEMDGTENAKVVVPRSATFVFSGSFAPISFRTQENNLVVTAHATGEYIRNLASVHGETE
ncbi:hypothetical protein B0H13DRAFT_2520513 [Mycena leptocephala]|nr:hypothetical protein B0H13DRAFT_2520513 [Mycena leptocephala]